MESNEDDIVLQEGTIRMSWENDDEDGLSLPKQLRKGGESIQ